MYAIPTKNAMPTEPAITGQLYSKSFIHSCSCPTFAFSDTFSDSPFTSYSISVPGNQIRSAKTDVL